MTSSPIAVLLLLLVGSSTIAASAGADAAAIKPKVTVSGVGCDGKDAKGRPVFRYTASWPVESKTPVTFIVTPSAACSLGGTLCRGAACTVTCTGTCRVDLGKCQLGIASWVQASTADRSYLSDRTNAPAPADCQTAR